MMRAAQPLPQLWTDALERRPELSRVEQQRRAATEQVTVARKQKWPVLTLALDGGTQGVDYRTGDLWGSVGAWFSGRWHTEPAERYIRDVNQHLRARTWRTPDFIAGDG